MPKRISSAQEEKMFPEFKVSKDRLILLLGRNATGDYKLKSLLIYQKLLKNDGRKKCGMKIESLCF